MKRQVRRRMKIKIKTAPEKIIPRDTQKTLNNSF